MRTLGIPLEGDQELQLKFNLILATRVNRQEILQKRKIYNEK